MKGSRLWKKKNKQNPIDSAHVCGAVGEEDRGSEDGGGMNTKKLIITADSTN